MSIPHVDISTGKIYGCEPGNREWYHEQGHLEFNNLESTSRLKLYQGYVFSLWMLTLTLSVLSKWFLIFSLPAVLLYLAIDMYEEHWCWLYADIQLKVKKNKKHNI